MVARFGLFSLLFSDPEELTPLRRLKKRKRKIDWREVRVGLARPVENKDSRTFVAKMAQYPELVPQLHSAAVDQGLSIYTLVFGVAEVANGLKEALEAKFTNFQFILDYPHFKQHLYQAVEAMELEPKWRSIWLNCAIDLIEGGRVKTIISRLKHWSGQGKEVVFNFAKYKEAVSSMCPLSEISGVGLAHRRAGKLKALIVISRKNA